MNEMEMRNGFGFNAERALRDEIMDKFLILGYSRPGVNAERERFLSVLLNGRAFRG